MTTPELSVTKAFAHARLHSGSNSEKQIAYVNVYIYRIPKSDTDEPICRAGIEVQTQRRDMWTQGRGKGGMGQIERVALTYIH